MENLRTSFLGTKTGPELGSRDTVAVLSSLVTLPLASRQKMLKEMEEALVLAAGSLSLLEHMEENLKVGLAEQVKRERARLEIEIEKASEKAMHAVQKWKDMQLVQLTKLDSNFTATKAAVCQVQERKNALETAMQIGRGVQDNPSLQEYCVIDKVLETLRAPLTNQSSDMRCITMGNGIRVVFHSNNLNESLALSLKMEVSSPEHLLESQPLNCPPDISKRESLQISAGNHISGCVKPSENNFHSSQKQDLQSFGVAQWVVVTHVVSPGHFYIRYIAENKQSEILSKKINFFCSEDRCHFTSKDTVETGSLVFAKYKDGLWCRATVVEILKTGSFDPVNNCSVTQLEAILIFFKDYGLTTAISIVSQEGNTESSLKSVNSHVRKVCEAVNVELGHFPPQAVRCSLKDLIPYDLERWSKKAVFEFSRLVRCTAAKMIPLGQDTETLLVDLQIAPMDQPCDKPISIKQHLVFIEEARFYCHVKPNMKTQLYYPAVYPKTSGEFSALVSHINSPADFYIHLIDSRESLLLHKKLQDFYCTTPGSSEEELYIYCPVIGQACVARFDDKLWYRAQVTGHVGVRQMEVCFVDFGDKRVVSASDLRKINDEFFALPSMAIHCCLPDVLPTEGDAFSDACNERFLRLTHQKVVTVVVTANVSNTEPLPVKVFQSSLNEPLTSISEMLVREKLACSKEGICEQVNRECALLEPADVEWKAEMHCSADVTSDDIAEVTTSLYKPPELPCLGVTRMSVSAVGDDGRIYARTQNAERELEQLREKIQQSMKMLPRQKPNTWKSVQGCVFIGSDMLWYRGQLLEVLGGSVKVQYVDYGLEESIPVDHVYPIVLCNDVLQLCLPCQLFGVPPVGVKWHQEAVIFLRQVLVKRTVDMQVVELPSDPRGPLTVQIHLDDLSPSSNLCQYQHASLDQAVSPLKTWKRNLLNKDKELVSMPLVEQEQTELE